MTYEDLVIIGRFQPFNQGDADVVGKGFSLAARVIMLIGSANVARSIRSPFTYEERARMISATFPSEIASGRLIVCPLDDTYNDVAWVASVQRAVHGAIREASIRSDGGPRPRTAGSRIAVAVCGEVAAGNRREKFPGWISVAIKPVHGRIGAEELVAGYLRRPSVLPSEACPPVVVAELDAFRQSHDFARLVEEAEWLAGYQKSWAAAPFAPTFVTVDCVVIQSGHVLLVRRGGQPGKGLLALPGGFLEPGDRLRQSAVRELAEETQIADGKRPIAPEGLIVDGATRVFDAPDRSIRGRTITHAFLFRCPDKRKLYTVKGGDDAAAAAWHRLGDLDPRDFFEDHWFILREMTGI